MTPSEPIARVAGGLTVQRDALVDRLLRMYGPPLVQDLAVTAYLRQLLERRGLVLRDEEVDREYRSVLAEMTDPLQSITGAAPDLRDAERVLEAVLAERNIPLEQFQLGVRRQALLRKLIEPEITVSDEEVERDVQSRLGERVEVRHIQVATASQVESVQRELRDGALFADVARLFSGNSATAARGGLLEPFAREDDRVPKLLREAAFALAPGAVSAPLRVGHWYHVLLLERRWPAAPAAEPALYEEARRRLLRRKQDEAMPALHRRVLEEAQIEVLDSRLREAWEAWQGR